MTVKVNDIRQAQLFCGHVSEWQSEINTQVIDLMFLQRILDIYGLKVAETSEAKDIAELKETLTSFLGHSVEGQKRRLRQHEEYLVNIAQDRVLLKDRDMPFKHKDMENEMIEFRTGYQRLRNALYEKVEQLKNFQ